MSNFNFLERERRKIFKELFRQYLDEGYNHKEAKRLAARDADEQTEADRDFIDDIYTAEYEDR